VFTLSAELREIHADNIDAMEGFLRIFRAQFFEIGRKLIDEPQQRHLGCVTAELGVVKHRLPREHPCLVHPAERPAEELPTALGFARYVTGHGDLAELEAYLERRVRDFLEATGHA